MNCTFVPVLAAVTFALAMTAPLGSATVPVTDPVMVCAEAVKANADSAKANKKLFFCILLHSFLTCKTLGNPG